MKKLNNKIIGWSVLLLFLFTVNSCDSQLDVPPPNSLTDEQIMALLQNGTPEEVMLVLGSLASDLDENFRLKGTYDGFGTGVMNYLTGQEMLYNLRANDIIPGESELGTPGDVLSLYSLNNAAIQPWLSNHRNYNYTWWMCAATPHTNANKVLAYLDKETVESGIAALKDYRARALCVRAFGYMMLMERYSKAYLHGGKDEQGMPIYTEYKINPAAPIASGEETYAFIKNDLNEAITLFKQAELSNDGYTTGSNATNDIDMGVAQFLLARVSLWTGDYTTCITACNDILAHYPDFIGEEAYGVKNTYAEALANQEREARAEDNAFTCIAINPECILGWVDGNGAHTIQYQYFNIFCEGNGGLGRYYMRMDNPLYHLIADEDYRKDLFLTKPIDYTYPTNGETYKIPMYANLKWGATICLGQEYRNLNVNSDYIYFRKSEVVLMLAEAQAQLGQDTAAKATLNTLLAARTKMDANILTCDNYPSMQGMGIMDMVKLQWRIEMWGENATDYFNSKRWNTAINRNGSSIHWSIGKELPVEYMTYQIPEQETNFNSYWNK